MSGVRIVDLVKPIASILPEVELPYEKVLFDEKMIYTIGVSAVYLLSSIPISGVNPSKIADPFYWLRLPFASEAGTLLEFGVLPVVTSAFLWQILAGFKIVRVDFTNITERQNFQSLQKLTAVLISIVFSILLCLSGYFESIDSFTRTNSLNGPGIGAIFLITCQLAAGTGITTLLVELLEKGYGFGPGVLAFTAVNSATKLSGSLFGFITNVSSGQSHGVVIQLFRNFFSKPLPKAVHEIFTRSDEVNLTQIYFVIFTLGLITYLQSFRMDISIKSSKVRSMVSNYPIRLFYCGGLPILFTFSIIYNMNIIAFSLCKIFGNLDLLAVYELDGFSKKTYHLAGGFLYFLSPSTGSSLLLNIIRIITLTLFSTVTSSLFGSYWYKMSGSSGKDLAKQFKDQDIVVNGIRDVNVARELNKLIASASAVGSTVLGLIIGLVEASGISNGLVTGIALGLLSALSLLETVMSEYQQTGAAANSQFSQVFGM